MKRKLIIVSLIVIFIIAAIIVIAYNIIRNSVINRETFEFKTENLGSIPIATISDDKNKEDRGETIYNKIDRYKILNDTEILSENKVENWKEIYETIVDSIYEYKKEIYIKEDIDNFYWISVAIENNIFVDLAVDDFESENHTLMIKYKYNTKEEHDKKIKEAESIILNLLNDVSENESNELEKVLMIYTYWATNIDYDYVDQEIPQVEDVLFEHRGICQNYSRMIDYCLNQMGIESYKVGGTILSNDEGHGWNLVKIYGNYYHMDATWESAGNTLGKGLEYFGLTDKEILDTGRKFETYYEEKFPNANSKKLAKLRTGWNYELDVNNHKIILLDNEGNIIDKISTIIE